jgi:phenylacetate-CoA ligase
MDWYPVLAKRVLYPCFDRLRGRNLSRRIAELDEQQWWSAEQIASYQLDRLQALLQHAAATVPYYTTTLQQSGLNPKALTSLKDLQQLPILTKARINENFDRMISTAFPIEQLVAGRTGGSTGVPTRFFHNTAALDYIRAAVIRNSAWAGLHIGEKYIKVSGSHFDYFLMQRLVSRITSRLLRFRWVSAYQLSPETLKNFLHELHTFKPVALCGYASAISQFAHLMKDNNISANVNTIMTSSDTLFPQQRAIIEEVFSCKVFDAYGSREMSIAAECEVHRGMHINADCVYIEILDDQGRPCPPGVTGRIVVTDLHNYAFPFIRYEIGDIGTFADEGTSCPCGRHLPRIASLEGRVDDCIRTPEGMIVTAPAFTIVFSDRPTVKEYQIVQHDWKHLTVNIVKCPKYSSDDEDYLRDCIVRMIGSDIQIAFEYVEGIDRGESGKRRTVISRLPREAVV